MEKLGRFFISKKRKENTMAKKKQLPVQVDKAEAQLKDFFDLVAPSAVKFVADHFIFGDTYKCVRTVREYPPVTSDKDKNLRRSVELITEIASVPLKQIKRRTGQENLPLRLALSYSYPILPSAVNRAACDPSYFCDAG